MALLDPWGGRITGKSLRGDTCVDAASNILRTHLVAKDDLPESVMEVIGRLVDQACYEKVAGREILLYDALRSKQKGLYQGLLDRGVTTDFKLTATNGGKNSDFPFSKTIIESCLDVRESWPLSLALDHGLKESDPPLFELLLRSAARQPGLSGKKLIRELATLASGISPAPDLARLEKLAEGPHQDSLVRWILPFYRPDKKLLAKPGPQSPMSSDLDLV